MTSNTSVRGRDLPPPYGISAPARKEKALFDVAVLVLAKAPVPGRVKTRLCPPLTPEQASDLARASLEDTLDAVAATPVARRVLVLDGTDPSLLWPGFDVVAQRGAGLDERLAHSFADAHALTGLPALLIGMDTPQVSPGLLAGAAEALLREGSVLGLTEDGGWWIAGVTTPREELFVGVPMSTDHTGSDQLARFAACGLTPSLAPTLRDVDTADDLRSIEEHVPSGSRTAAALRHLEEMCVL